MMGSAAKRKKRKHLISSFTIRSPQGISTLNPRTLKSLLALLYRLSLNQQQHPPPITSSKDSTQLPRCGFSFKDFHHLSNLLFNQLDTAFRTLFSALHREEDKGKSFFIEFQPQQLTLLLRCCLVMLVLIGYEHKPLLEKGSVLLSILARLISIELLNGGNGKTCITFRKLVSRRCVDDDDDCTTSITEEFVASLCLWEPSDPRYASLLAVLEVFADELLVNKLLRQYFMVIDSALPRSERLFMSHFGHGYIASILEVICAHFLVSLSDEQAFENFLNRLFWCRGEDFRIPEISLPAALSLLLNPIILSAPKMFQAYLVLLVSETIGICMPCANIVLDLKLMDRYSAAFERSVFLYSRHMSSLCIDDHLSDNNGSFVKSCLPGRSGKLTFESLLQPATREKLFHLISKSNDAWDAYLSDTSSRTSSDLMTSSISYLKENQNIANESYKDEVFRILSCITIRGSSDDISGTVLYKKGETSPQDIYLLASIMKLMGSSMLQAIWYVRFLKSSGLLKSKVSSWKGWGAIVDVLGCFEHFSMCLPIQKFLSETLQSHPARHKKSKWMLLHFSGLLSLSYASGFEFLVKDCLFILSTLLNLFIIEEGDLSTLGSLIGSNSESFSSKSSDKWERAQVVQNSSQIVTSKIQKIQEMYLSRHSVVSSNKRKRENEAGSLESGSVLNGMDPAVTSMEDNKETCNGEMFLKCILGQRAKSSDIDDLSDFIECRQGKNYYGWLMDRQRFRLWKYKKTTIRRLKRKRKAWNFRKRGCK